MSIEGLIAFLGAATLLIVTPGQDMALVFRNTLGCERRTGTITALGVASGLVVWAIVASAGLTAVLQASQLLFNTLKIAGALYLGYLGVQALRAAMTPIPKSSAPATSGLRPGGSNAFVAYRQGLVSNLGNPKIAVFFSSLLPQFVSGSGDFLPLLGLGLLFCCLTFAWLASYVVLVDRLSGVMRRSRVRRALEAVTGAVLVGLALRLVTTRG